MKSKNIKVAYSTHYSKTGTTTVPKLQIEGKWLEELGFSIGSTIKVEYEEGSIHIRPLTEEEQFLSQQEKIQSEIKRKSTELLQLENTCQSLSKVAESPSKYGTQ